VGRIFPEKEEGQFADWPQGVVAANGQGQNRSQSGGGPEGGGDRHFESRMRGK
jgi:hypothetical protein